jgi:hypothetical protein
MIKSLHPLIKELEARSPLIRGMNLTASVPDNQIARELLNFANRSADLDRVARATETLVSDAGLSLADAESAVQEVISQRHFYGVYCELGGYDWLARHDAKFAAQVQLSGSEVLNPHGCKIDGRFSVLDAAFDIKAMGFQAYVANQFCAALELQLNDQVVTIDGPMDVAVKDIEQFAFPKLSTFRTSLSNGGIERIAELGWTVQARKRPSAITSVHSQDPYRLAEENRYYPFKSAGQFCRTMPFVLIFTYAAQFNQALAVNFVGSSDVSLRSMARRAFMQLTADMSPAVNFDNQVRAGVTIGDAARLLSGLLFLNLDNDKGWLFLNPRATLRLTRYHVEQLFDFAPMPNLGIDDFVHDNY